MPPDGKSRRGPATPSPDNQNPSADQAKDIGKVAAASCRSFRCVIACSPASCYGCADRVEVAA